MALTFVGGSGIQVLILPVNNAVFLVKINPPGQFDKIEVWITDINGTNNVRLENFLFGTSVIPEDQPLHFDVAAVDGDGDVSATAGFDVLLQGGAGPNYTLTGIPVKARSWRVGQAMTQSRAETTTIL